MIVYQVAVENGRCCFTSTSSLSLTMYLLFIEQLVFTISAHTLQWNGVVFFGRVVTFLILFQHKTLPGCTCTCTL